MADPIKLADLPATNFSGLVGEENLYAELANASYGRVKTGSVFKTQWPFAGGFNWTLGGEYDFYSADRTYNRQPVQPPKIKTPGIVRLLVGTHYFVLPARKKLYLDKIAECLNCNNSSTQLVLDVATGGGGTNVWSGNAQNKGSSWVYDNFVLADNSGGNTLKTVLLNFYVRKFADPVTATSVYSYYYNGMLGVR